MCQRMEEIVGSGFGLAAEMDGEESPCGEEIDARNGLGEEGDEDLPTESPDENEGGEGDGVDE